MMHVATAFAFRVAHPHHQMQMIRSAQRNSYGHNFRCGFASHKPPKLLRVLGIETTCDETGAAVVTSDGQILGESLASQWEFHYKQFGGVHPLYAKRAHETDVAGIIEAALKKSGVDAKDLDAVAVATGPGLALCLTVGLNAARAIIGQTVSQRPSPLPLVPVNHLEAHVLVPRLADQSLHFPFLTLLVSGGHSQLLLARGVNNYKFFGGTLDDSVGEVFDKVARYLSAPTEAVTSGGEAIEKLAKQGDPSVYNFTVPLQHQKDCNFSFAGLKAQVVRTIKKVDLNSSEGMRSAANIAASFQRAAVAHLLVRTRRAMKRCEDEQLITSSDTESHRPTLVVAGGVARNTHLRSELERLSTETGWRVTFPEPRLCTDNGVMIAWAGLERFKAGLVSPALEVDIKPRWPLDEEFQRQQPKHHEALRGKARL